MQTNLDLDALSRVTFLTGNKKNVTDLPNVLAKTPFDKEITDFLNDVSGILMSSKIAKKYSDIVTFAFWIRRASLEKLKERFCRDDSFRLGKGVAFHIAPSNVPVNFAYSLVSGLVTGNANIVRVPSKEFEQVSIITDAINEALNDFEVLRQYVILVRYERDRKINDLFSSMADLRVVWGGDATIEELRRSPLPPRSGEITFADRYSIAVIDSDSYLEIENKVKTAEDFYNDTFLSDQNACTSPRIVIWTGSRIGEAKELFWDEAHKLVEKKYEFQAIQAVNKLNSAYLSATAISGSMIEAHEDNLIVRIRIPEVSASLMDYRDNSGYFFEYECENVLEIRDLCDDKRCQTIACIGDVNMLLPLIKSGVRGIDRIVPMGKTMDFDLIWDGYDLTGIMTRVIAIHDK